VSILESKQKSDTGHVVLHRHSTATYTIESLRNKIPYLSSNSGVVPSQDPCSLNILESQIQTYTLHSPHPSRQGVAQSRSGCCSGGSLQNWKPKVSAN